MPPVISVRQHCVTLSECEASLFRDDTHELHVDFHRKIGPDCAPVQMSTTGRTGESQFVLYLNNLTRYLVWMVKDTHGRLLTDPFSHLEIYVHDELRVSGGSDLFSHGQFLSRGLEHVDGYYAYFFCFNPRSAKRSGSINMSKLMKMKFKFAWKPSVAPIAGPSRSDIFFNATTIISVR